MEKTYYFSFGVGHIFRDYLIEITGTGVDIPECHHEARRIMMNSFGTQWCEQYDENNALELAEKYNYHLMKLNENYVFEGNIYE